MIPSASVLLLKMFLGLDNELEPKLFRSWRLPAIEIFAEIRIKGSEAHVALQKILLLFQDLDSPTQILIHQFGSGSDAGSAKHEFLK